VGNALDNLSPRRELYEEQNEYLHCKDVRLLKVAPMRECSIETFDSVTVEVPV
jgi:hypothetical protein